MTNSELNGTIQREETDCNNLIKTFTQIRIHETMYEVKMQSFILNYL